MSYELLFQRAVQLHEAGQLNEAEQIYRRILETAPQQPEVRKCSIRLMVKQKHAKS